MGRSMHHEGGRGQYLRLLVMTALSFFSMYWLMYAMVNVRANVINNLNQFYMAGLMAGAMVIIEILVMSGMYADKKRNLAIIAASILGLLVFWLCIRKQTGISDEQFLRSMIPHHSGAILMCEQASLTDPGIKDLCEGIISSQQFEIEQMKVILKKIESKQQ